MSSKPMFGEVDMNSITQFKSPTKVSLARSLKSTRDRPRRPHIDTPQVVFLKLAMVYS